MKTGTKRGSSASKGMGMMALFLITGAVVGGILGELASNSSLLSGVVPYLIKPFPVFDLPPVAINLYVIKVVIGFALYPNLMSILGIIAAIILFRRF
ncbi:DUF4321 domain-containing protein [Sporomusa sp.]|uniref:DUF4321 domain-containing protein n=1 Tax=Sporomusa sp. TaxID=2078658 RepID=UPI002BFFBEE3|nr:DUF4321 domain-containing protein [Sporomusa sp.]HWR44641.1 DUF4321 domain-containing protein [Sporomusa sp.]